jgi:hypothetical protein
MAFAPMVILPSITKPPPTPVPRMTPKTTDAPAPAPSTAPDSAQQLASFSIRTLRPSRAARSAAGDRPIR